MMLTIKSFNKWKNNNNNEYIEIDKILKEKYSLSLEKFLFISYSQNWCDKSTDEYKLNKLHQDVHSPSISRVNTVLYNNQNFLDTFNCINKITTCQL